jgi:hypothetical protein
MMLRTVYKTVRVLSTRAKSTIPVELHIGCITWNKKVDTGKEVGSGAVAEAKRFGVQEPKAAYIMAPGQDMIEQHAACDSTMPADLQRAELVVVTGKDFKEHMQEQVRDIQRSHYR